MHFVVDLDGNKWGFSSTANVTAIPKFHYRSLLLKRGRAEIAKGDYTRITVGGFSYKLDRSQWWRVVEGNEKEVYWTKVENSVYEEAKAMYCQQFIDRLEAEVASTLEGVPENALRFNVQVGNDHFAFWAVIGDAQ